MNKKLKRMLGLTILLIACFENLNAQNKNYKIEAQENIKNKAYTLKIRPQDGVKTNKTYPEWQSIDDESITFEMNESGPVLIQLNAVDTWNEGGAGTWYAIEVSGQIKTQTIAFGFHGQRVPITLSTIENLPKGKVVIKAKWCTVTGGTSFMGGWSVYQLMAVKI
jgi:hypothetical protein